MASDPTGTAQAKYHIGFKTETIKLFEPRNVSTCLEYLLPPLESLPPTFSLLDVGCGQVDLLRDNMQRFIDAWRLLICTEIICRLEPW
ncbi:hypothetical protein QQZ08_010406 [Neonectria magnoliae]|uniref:Small RNA 2'-O-methyltransferase n=1 Tax=Neonectria magnoliae TaxID=2732573 RepID=A0ABR1HHC5_9HYPO